MRHLPIRIPLMRVTEATPCTPACRPPLGPHAHCRVCHRTLAGSVSYDAHRTGGRCIDVARAGLVEVGGLWASPAAHRVRADLVSRFTPRPRPALADPFTLPTLGGPL